ncbi:MAG: GNAT family N-acetyltransferase [Propioniciclava sp.]
MSLSGWRRWPVILRHETVVLRPFRLRDEKPWQELRGRNAGWTLPWDATRPPESAEPGQSFVDMVRAGNADGRAGRALPWAIALELPTGQQRLVGQMTISGIAGGSARWGMAGYWVSADVAGRGIAPTALALAADHMFGPMRRLHRLEVAIRPENHKSIRVVEKLGLRREGIRPGYMHVNGAWRDHVVYAIHSDEVGPQGLIARLAAPE